MKDDKALWAENLLRQKYKELGKAPTKKDFDEVTRSRIKAALGPWPRALEAAGIKKQKQKLKIKGRKKNENYQKNAEFAVGTAHDVEPCTGPRFCRRICVHIRQL